MFLLEVREDDDLRPWPQRCVLCEWTTQDPTGEQLAEDDGITFDQAQENVRRYAWMYDPENPPEWMTLTPNDEELTARRHLVELFEQIDSQARRGYSADDLWKQAKALEETIGDLAREREHNAEANARDALGPGDEDGELPNDFLLSP